MHAHLITNQRHRAYGRARLVCVANSQLYNGRADQLNNCWQDLRKFCYFISVGDAEARGGTASQLPSVGVCTRLLRRRALHEDTAGRIRDVAGTVGH